VLGVEQDDIKDCCYRMICLYQRSKPDKEALEREVDSLKAQLDESRRVARGLATVGMVDSPASQPSSPVRQERNGEESKGRGSEGEGGRERSRSHEARRGRRKKGRRERSHSAGSDRENVRGSKSRKSKKRERSWSHSPIHKSRKGGRSRSREQAKGAGSHHLSHDRGDHRSHDRDRDRERGGKYDHKAYQEKYKKGDRIERDHYRR
jgi:hypothetical protein